MATTRRVVPGGLDLVKRAHRLAGERDELLLSGCTLAVAPSRRMGMSPVLSLSRMLSTAVGVRRQEHTLALRDEGADDVRDGCRLACPRHTQH